MNISRCADCPRPVSRLATRCHPCAARKAWVDGKYADVRESNPIAPLAQKRDPAPLRDGDTYMVFLKDEGRAMMARVFPDSGVVRLQPINRKLPSVFKKPCDIEIRGRVLKTLRYH